MQHVKPMFGYAIVREKAPSELTAGGIVAPGSVDARRWFIEEVSEGHMQEGHLVPCTLSKGDEVIPIPKLQQAIHPKTQEVMKREVIETLQPPHFPRDLHMMRLSAIAGYTPAAEVKSTVGESPIQLVPAGALPGRVH